MGWLFADDDGRRGEDDGPRPEDNGPRPEVDGPRPLGIWLFELNNIVKVKRGYRLFYLWAGIESPALFSHI